MTPPANASVHSLFRSACPARWIATSDDEHAVSTDIAGPSNPSAYATRPDATLAVVPVSAMPSDQSAGRAPEPQSVSTMPA